MSFDQAIDTPKILQAGEVTVSLMDEKIRYNLRLKSKDIAAIKKDYGLKLPAKIGGSSRDKNTTIIKLGPDEWLVIAKLEEARKLSKSLAKLSKEFICSVTEISHRNVAFQINGEAASKTVNIGCPLDLSLEKFPIGKGVRTIFESSPIILLRTGEQQFHIECWRSFGPYLRDYFLRIVSTR